MGTIPRSLYRVIVSVSVSGRPCALPLQVSADILKIQAFSHPIQQVCTQLSSHWRVGMRNIQVSGCYLCILNDHLSSWHFPLSRRDDSAFNPLWTPFTWIRLKELLLISEVETPRQEDSYKMMAWFLNYLSHHGDKLWFFLDKDSGINVY